LKPVHQISSPFKELILVKQTLKQNLFKEKIIQTSSELQNAQKNSLLKTFYSEQKIQYFVLTFQTHCKVKCLKENILI